jgi:hypothetical protein
MHALDSKRPSVLATAPTTADRTWQSTGFTVECLLRSHPPCHSPLSPCWLSGCTEGEVMMLSSRGTTMAAHGEAEASSLCVSLLLPRPPLSLWEWVGVAAIQCL